MSQWLLLLPYRSRDNAARQLHLGDEANRAERLNPMLEKKATLESFTVDHTQSARGLVTLGIHNHVLVRLLPDVSSFVNGYKYKGSILFSIEDTVLFGMLSTRAS